MARQGDQLLLPRCPHCQIDHPHLKRTWQGTTKNFAERNLREWGLYRCASCGGLVLAGNKDGAPDINELYPSGRSVADEIPERARELLSQGYASVHAPAAAVVMAATSVDAMLKALGRVDGSLYNRIDAAVAEHALTAEMGAWAHDVRLDANDVRHANIAEPLPTEEDAVRALEFAVGLADYLFVMPARVKRGRAKSGTETPGSK